MNICFQFTICILPTSGNPIQISGVFWSFWKNKQCTIVQRSLRRIHHNNLPSNKSILEWYNDFIERGCICDQRKGHSGRPAVSEEVFERVRDSYLRSPKKSTRRCSQELQLLQRTVSNMLRKCLRFTPNKLQLVQMLYPRGKEARFEFYHIVQEPMENDPDLLSEIIFSDEATFHLSGKMNNVRIWGTQNPHVTLESERNSLKVNVFYAVRTVYKPSIFEGLSITGSSMALMFAGEQEGHISSAFEIR
ncbi:hypothetical protein PoB_004489500 [Plakobranchus ocellatus]|uniref:DUF4817 domain-containing protein n=1 Tax=Plakobranchus ocellatus TaxID=259542 RepID=A0AAV4BH21_9GAST|nr:hypothetical protein PoB_004489500 [Plakobranchus ocellatus]